MSPQISIINDVVMDQRCGMNHFHDGSQLYGLPHPVVMGSGCFGCQENQNRANLLSLIAGYVFAKLLHERIRVAKLASQLGPHLMKFASYHQFKSLLEVVA